MEKPMNDRFAPLDGICSLPAVANEPVRTYAPGSPERAAIKARLEEMAGERIELPLVIGGQEVRTGKLQPSVMPHRHGHILADAHHGGPRRDRGRRRCGTRCARKLERHALAGARGRVPARGRLLSGRAATR